VVVFDRGYAGYGCFAALTGQKVWFMTRLKKDAKFKRVKKNECTGQNMVSDYEIIIPGYSAEKYLKKIIARNPDTGKKITLLTSNLRWAASTVSAVYKDRWQTELFLRG
jgi:putative transposase